MGRSGCRNFVGKMMGCFSTSKVEKQRSWSAPRSGPLRSVIASKDSLGLLSNKPVELPDPRSIVSGRNLENENGVESAAVRRLSRFGDEACGTQVVKRAEGGRKAFSGPLVSSAAHNEAMGARPPGSRLQRPNYESSYEAPRLKSAGARALRRTTSFGGRPQPLPLPVTDEALETLETVGALGTLGTLAPATTKPEVRSPRRPPLDGTTRRPREVRSFKLEEGSLGSWKKGGRVTPVAGLPLPPPSLGSKLVPTRIEVADR